MSTLLEIDPAILASIHNFDWMVRSLALGEYHGRKISKRLGTGMEFSQYRPYSQGDDLRQLDWKMYARSDKFYIKQSEVETNVSVTFILDHSRSMTYEESNWSKLDFGKILTGVLAYVAMENGDRVGIAGKSAIRPDNSARHWLRILTGLFEMKAEKSFTPPFIENRRSKELFVIVSDLYDETSELLDFIKSLKSRRNEVIVFHLMGNKETTLEFGNAVKFRDLELGTALQVNTESYRSSYVKNLDNWINFLRAQFLPAAIDYHRVNFHHPIQDVVKAFLNSKKQLG